MLTSIPTTGGGGGGEGRNTPSHLMLGNWDKLWTDGHYHYCHCQHHHCTVVVVVIVITTIIETKILNKMLQIKLTFLVSS